MPKYVVFNNKTWEVVATGNDHNELLTVYNGKAYEIAQTAPVGYRIEW